MTSAEPGRRNLVERALGVFAEVRAGEGVTTVLLTVNVFLLLAAYYVIKTLRETEILSRGMLGLSGPELKAYATAGQAFLLLGVVPAYAALAGRVGRMKLINITTVIFAVCLGVFALLAGALHLSIGLAYYLWVGIFNVMVVAQFWSFANDLCSEEQGKRLFPVIAVGGSLGAISGPFITSMAKSYPYQLMAATTLILLTCMALYNLVDRIERRKDRAAGPSRANAGEALGKGGGFRLVMRDRYLLLLAFMVLLMSFVNTTGEFLLSERVVDSATQEIPDSAFPELPAEDRQAAIKAARGQFIGDVYGRFYGLVNLISFLIQAFLVSRIFKYLGVRVALLFLPVLALGGYALIFLIPTLAVVRISKTAENSTDYSLQNTVRQALFLPTGREAKYKAKAAIDTFFVRVGDSAAAFLVFAGIHWLGFGTRGYAAVCVGASVLFLILAVAIGRQYRRLVAATGEAD